MTALRQLTDAGVSPSTRAVLLKALQPLVPSAPAPGSNGSSQSHTRSPSDALLAITDLRAMRTGANMFVDLTAHVPRTLSVEDAAAVEQEIRDALVKARRDVKEVRVKFKPVREDA